MADRAVRFTEAFFDQLDLLLPEERGADGTPSITDFLVFELPPIRDLLAVAFEDNTLETSDPSTRVLIGTGNLVRALAVYATTDSWDGAVEVFWITIDRHSHPAVARGVAARTGFEPVPPP